MAPSSRMQLARRRLRVARYSIGAVAVTAFAAFGFAVRDAHPATSKSPTTAGTSSSATTSEGDDQFSSPAAISPAPQYVPPTIQSSGS